jgi:hypothetical protein
MDEEAFLHRVSVDTNVNIELLKDLLHNEKFHALVASGKTMQAIALLRSIQPRVGLREAKMVVDAFAAEK